ncbi:hypothetical protein AVEN_149148-1 [Araneus ventricosus]|uniref:Uncharacterized protein n=1 Tax=Araneus ventricosus TaxID=182803 RepID=A0A4Y2LLA0_ARAVE|nr:hypothetical protein AVEN_149148-1 [Araneus ventricosus]
MLVDGGKGNVRVVETRRKKPSDCQLCTTWQDRRGKKTEEQRIADCRTQGSTWAGEKKQKNKEKRIVLGNVTFTLATIYVKNKSEGHKEN